MIHVKVIAPGITEARFPIRWENSHGDVTRLVSLETLQGANCDLARARLRYRIAAHALARIRGKLNQVLELAYQQQSFGPLNALFDKEELALAAYQRAVDDLAHAEERMCALRAALDYEKKMMLAGLLSRNRLN